MAKASRDRAEVNARVVYWGVEGSGKRANLNTVFAKLRADHRGELRSEPTPLDPSVAYQVLPIELGEIAGVRTRIEMVAAPGGTEQAPTRKQLLDQVDGLVLVIDSQGEKLDENVESFKELRQTLASYGRSLEEVPLVVQYNKRDLADPYAVEELHRKLDLRGAAVFEAVATEGTGVLETLSTISKRVIRSLRDQANPQANRR
jgi:signal recognition particle receptor subunit beta